VGLSPAASTFVTGFSLILSPLGTFSSSTQVTGKVLAASYKSPTPSTLTTSVGALIAAFNDAKGRVNPTAIELGAGMYPYNRIILLDQRLLFSLII
jgi:hypothetical protein